MNDTPHHEPPPKFRLGRCCITPHALARLTHEDVMRALERHVTGDWGDVNEADRQENELSLREGFRLLSVYHSPTGLAYWVITEADRSLTTILLPEDY